MKKQYYLERILFIEDFADKNIRNLKKENLNSKDSEIINIYTKLSGI